MNKFEERKYYMYEADKEHAVKVLRRTAKYVLVRNRHYEWRMLIRTDANGNEYLLDPVSISHPFHGDKRMRINATDTTEKFTF